MVFLLVLFGLISVFVWYVRGAERQREQRLRDFLAPGDSDHRPPPVVASRHGMPAPRKPVHARSRSRGKRDDEDDDDLGPVVKTPAPADAVPAFYDESYTTPGWRAPAQPESNRGRRSLIDVINASSPSTIDDALEEYLRSPPVSRSHDYSSSSSSYGRSSSSAPDKPCSSDSASGSGDTSSCFGSGSSGSSSSSSSSGSSDSSDSDSSDD